MKTIEEFLEEKAKREQKNYENKMPSLKKANGWFFSQDSISENQALKLAREINRRAKKRVVSTTLSTQEMFLQDVFQYFDEKLNYWIYEYEQIEEQKKQIDEYMKTVNN